MHETRNHIKTVRSKTNPKRDHEKIQSEKANPERDHEKIQSEKANPERDSAPHTYKRHKKPRAISAGQVHHQINTPSYGGSSCKHHGLA